GVVTRRGEGVTRFKTGDRVMAILAYGGFAEQALADEAETFPIPDAMPFDEAGAFPIAYISSHVAIRWQGRLEAGETLLVRGGARLVVRLLPLARAGQAWSVCRRAARVVREGHAEAARHTSAAARARRRGHSPAQRPQGTRQGRHHAGASRLMELRAEPHGPHVVVVAIDNQPRRNAMPRAMMAELATLWDRLERDGTC